MIYRWKLKQQPQTHTYTLKRNEIFVNKIIETLKIKVNKNLMDISSDANHRGRI